MTKVSLAEVACVTNTNWIGIADQPHLLAQFGPHLSNLVGS